MRRVKSVNCEAIIKGDVNETDKASKYMKQHPRKWMNDKELSKFAQNCTALKERGYITDGITQEELDFPLAFSILMYKQAVQAEILLRVLYRPQNVYCIHLDLKTSDDTYKAMESISNCFPNVFLVKKREEIIYASITRLQAELNCMKESLETPVDWKYYMNYASTMFPLKTNLEMVKILKIYNGTNDINGMPPIKSRYNHSFKYVGSKNKRLARTKNLKDGPPEGLNITKGSIYAIFTRDFCKFMLDDPLAKKLLAWSNDTYSPDEHFASTLHHVGRNLEVLGKKQVPGSYSGKLFSIRTYRTGHKHEFHANL